MTELVSSLENLHRLFSWRTVVFKSIDMLTAEQHRATIQYLLDGVDQDTQLEAAKDILAKLDKDHRSILLQHLLLDQEARSPSIGLPQKLRGAMHELTRMYPANIVVDAAMHELPESDRANVARAFLPRTPLREKLGLKDAPPRRYTWVVGSTRGAVLGTADEAPEEVRVIENGQQVSYTRKRVVPEYDFREDENAPQVRMLAVYSKDGGQ